MNAAAPLIAYIKDALKRKLGNDLLWTFGSFAVLAVCGVLLNIVIAALRDANALGVFNISYAAYLIGSQLATMGVHYSVLRHAAYHADNPHERGAMLGSAMLLTCILGVLASAALYTLAPLTEPLFDSAEVAESLHYAAWGLLLFPLNKVLISYINGLRHMRAFSLLQSLRYITVLAAVTALCFTDIDFTHASLSFFIAEALTTIATLVYLFKTGKMHALMPRHHWIKTHIVFGSKGAAGGIFLDMNTRLDVLLLGMFLSPREVGIYSFAAMLVDGIQHLLAIIRVNFNPILVAALRDRQWEEARRLLHLSRRYVTLGVIIVSLLIVVGFWIMATSIATGKGFEAGLPSLMILLFAFIVVGGYSPFDHLLMVSGHPGYQTVQIVTITLVNVLSCVILVPIIGIEGAALGTGFGYIAGMILMIVFAYRLLSWDMLRNRIRITS